MSEIGDTQFTPSLGTTHTTWHADPNIDRILSNTINRDWAGSRVAFKPPFQNRSGASARRPQQQMVPRCPIPA